MRRYVRRIFVNVAKPNRLKYPYTYFYKYIFIVSCDILLDFFIPLCAFVFNECRS